MTRSADLITALCGRGWDSPQPIDLASARELLGGTERLTFYAAIVAGEVEQVRRFLQEDPTLVKREGGPREWAPLLYATCSCADQLGRADEIREVMRVLLDGGADPNAA